MKILIGGSPGTGSSLFRQMLNRHPDIYCGPETQLFTHPVLFQDWKSNSGRMLSRPRLRSPGVYPVKGCRLSGREQQWTDREVGILINKSNNINEFCELYFSKPLSVYNKKYWGEKTPDNVIVFREFVKHFDDGVILLIVRDPLDTIASLISRGFTVFTAIVRYLFNNAVGLRSSRSGRMHIVSYERLVHEPEESLTDLFHSFGSPLSEATARRMCEPGNPMMTEEDQLKGWRASEIDKPRTRSVGRFRDLPDDLQDLITDGIKSIRLADEFAQRHAIECQSIADVASKLNYSLDLRQGEVSKRSKQILRKGMRLYRWNAIKTRHLFFEKENPVEIS